MIIERIKISHKLCLTSSIPIGRIEPLNIPVIMLRAVIYCKLHATNADVWIDWWKLPDRQLALLTTQ